MKPFLEKTIVEAGRITMGFFGKGSSVTSKSDVADVVTAADLASQQWIVGSIQREYPYHGIVAEEEGLEEIKEYTWYVDPLDGTSNFVAGLPLFGISMALAHEGIVVEAGLYLPATDEFLRATLEHGAYLNGQRIARERKVELSHSSGCVPSRLKGRKGDFHAVLLSRANEGFLLSSFGSTVVSAVYVACGRRDWLVSFDNHSWDYAASALILKESGCKATNEKGADWTVGDGELIAASPPLHQMLMNMVRESVNMNWPSADIVG